MTLPKNFSMVDKMNDPNLHKGIVYICRDNTFEITKFDKQIAFVKYDENWNPETITMNGVPCKKEYGLVHYWHDPRHFLYHGEKINLQKYGLKGEGYVVQKTEPELIIPECHSIIQINSPTQFTRYLFMLKKSGWREVKSQRTIFTITEI